MSDPTKALPERLIIALLFAVQMVNVLDFVMVMPLGPDFSRALGIPESDLGYLGGSYTGAAAVAGLIGSTFLDRFDRRSVLLWSLVGLSLATAAGGFATGFGSLLFARVLAGIFGGPATSIGFAIIADVIPGERRGKAIGTLAAAFSVVSVLGLPFSLWLAERADWHAPFFAVALLGLVTSVLIAMKMPSLTLHLQARREGLQQAPWSNLVRRPEILLSYAMATIGFLAMFMLIPNLSAFVQHNLGLPRSELGFLYLAGGVASFIAMRLAGTTVDRFGSTRVAVGGTVGFVSALVAGFVVTPALISPLGIFLGFMVANAFRMVSINTIVSKIPGPSERARFMSAQSAVQHLASAAGAVLAARFLSTGTRGELIGIDRIALVAAAMSVVVPFVMWRIERRMRSRDRREALPLAA